MELRLNCQKAERALGWRGRLPLVMAVQWTSDWFRRYLTGGSARRLCQAQIDDYHDVRVRGSGIRTCGLKLLASLVKIVRRWMRKAD
jgi:hypothetical protein